MSFLRRRKPDQPTGGWSVDLRGKWDYIGNGAFVPASGADVVIRDIAGVVVFPDDLEAMTVGEQFAFVGPSLLSVRGCKWRGGQRTFAWLKERGALKQEGQP